MLVLLQMQEQAWVHTGKDAKPSKKNARPSWETKPSQP